MVTLGFEPDAAGWETRTLTWVQSYKKYFGINLRQAKIGTIRSAQKSYVTVYSYLIG